MMTLSNRRYFTRQFFEISATGLRVDKKTLLDQYEFEIPFGHIDNKIKIQSITNNNLIVISIAFFIFGILFLFGNLNEASPLFFIMGMIFLLLTVFTRKKTVIIATYTRETIEIFFKNSNKAEVEYFAIQIIDASKKFLLNKYGKVDKALPIEPQMNDLNFLRDREVISDDQYQQLKNQLLSRDNIKTIGFGRP